MPSLTIHAKVGYEIGKKLHLNSYNYYLGILAPDAPNLNGFAEKKERWAAHVRREDLNDWRDALKKFYQNNKNKYNHDFLLGYYIHILTDIIFDDYFYFDIRRKIVVENYSEQEAHQLLNNDMYDYYFTDYETMRDVLKQSQDAYNINNITKELLLAWKEQFLNLPPKANSRKYVTEESISKLIDLVYKELLESDVF